MRWGQWDILCPRLAAAAPHRAGDAEWLCTASLSRRARGVDAAPVPVSLGAAAVCSVPCSSASVFYNGDIQLWLVPACETLCLLEIQQLLSIFILVRCCLINPLSRFPPLSLCEQGLCRGRRACRCLRGRTSSAPCRPWAAIGPKRSHPAAAGGLHLDRCSSVLGLWVGFYLT